MFALPFLILPLGAVLLCRATPVAPPGKTYDFEKVFDVDFNSGEHGGCGVENGEYTESITKGYYETIEAIHGALQSLEWLSGLDEDSSDCPDFLRITQTFESSFGGQAWKDSKATTAVVQVIKVYTRYLTSHQVSITSTTPPYHLRCGDQWLRFFAPSSTDPRDDGQPDADKYTLSDPRPGHKVFPGGALYAAGLPADKSFIPVDKAPEDPRSPVCGRDNRAVSDRGLGLLILCEKLYMVAPFNLGQLSLAHNTESIQEGDTLDDNFERHLAGTWIHEMGHYVNGWVDPQIRNKQGEEVAVYSWKLATEYAKTKKGDPVDAPENYSLFAVAMYYAHYDWSTGVARKEPVL